MSNSTISRPRVQWGEDQYGNSVRLVGQADDNGVRTRQSAHDDIQAMLREREMRSIGFGKRSSLCG